MGAQSYNDVVATQIEAVMPLLTGFFDNEDALFSTFEKIPAKTQSGRNMRMPIELRPGGKTRAVDLDNGSLGTGSGPVYDYTAMSPVDAVHAISWSLKSKFTTDSNDKAVVDTVQRTIASGIKEAKIKVDKHLQGAGTGVLASISDATSAPTFTVKGTNFGARLLRFGDDVAVYHHDQSAYYGVLTVAAIDYQAGTVTLSASAIGGHSLVATDVLCVAGLTATPPTWTYGLPYHHNNAATGTWLGWNRANYPEVRTPWVDGGSSNLTVETVQKLLAYIDGELGEDVFDSGKWLWYFNPKQHFQLVSQMQTISEITLPMGGGGNGQVDLAFSRKRQRVLCDMPIKTSINADPGRVDLIDVKNWMRGTYKELEFLKLGGSTVLPVPNGTSYDATEISYLTWSQQFACRNPRRAGYISNLRIPL